MSRKARVVVEGVPHHITQRGNNRQDVFLLDEDRRFYIEVLRAKSEQHGLTILGRFGTGDSGQDDVHPIIETNK